MIIYFNVSDRCIWITKIDLYTAVKRHHIHTSKGELSKKKGNEAALGKEVNALYAGSTAENLYLITILLW